MLPGVDLCYSVGIHMIGDPQGGEVSQLRVAGQDVGERKGEEGERRSVVLRVDCDYLDRGMGQDGARRGKGRGGAGATRIVVL